jgi:hypothetical protein
MANNAATPVDQEADVMQEERPYLPQLESVECRADPSVRLVLVLYGGMILIFLTGLLRGFIEYGRYIPFPGQLIFGIAIALFLIGCARVLFTSSTFKTDPDGLSVRGPLRGYFIRWSDINGVSTTTTLLQHRLLVIKTQERAYRIDPDGLRSCFSDALQASIWQHLNGLGRANGMDLSPTALTLWSPIPEGIPDELTWGKSPSTLQKVGGWVIPLVWLCFCSLLVSVYLHLGLTPWRAMQLLVVASLAVAVGYMMWDEASTRGRMIQISRDHLAADRLFDRIEIPWSDVTGTLRQRSGLLVIANKKRVLVPFSLGDKDSEALTLAVIRYLREAGTPHPLVIPETVTSKPELIDEPCAGKTAASRQLAFINSLPEPCRSVIRRLNTMQTVTTLTGMFLPLVLVLTDSINGLSALLHAGADTRYFISGMAVILGFPLMMAGGMLAWQITTLLCDRRAGPYRDEWMKLQRIGDGKHQNQWKYLAAVVIVVASVTVVLFLNCYTRVTDNGIAVNRLFHFNEQFYPWKEVSAVTTNRDGADLCFKDGSTQSILAIGRLPAHQERVYEAIQFIVTKTGKPVSHNRRPKIR